jgi:hypothetical protein
MRAYIAYLQKQLGTWNKRDPPKTNALSFPVTIPVVRNLLLVADSSISDILLRFISSSPNRGIWHQNRPDEILGAE